MNATGRTDQVDQSSCSELASWNSDQILILRGKASIGRTMIKRIFSLILVTLGATRISGQEKSEPLFPIPGPAAPNKPKPEMNSLKMTLMPLKAGVAKLGKGSPLSTRRTMELSSMTAGDKLALLAKEPPRRDVQITKDFWIGAHEVTIGQFRAFVRDSNYRTDAEKDGKGGTGLLSNGSFADDPKFNWEQYGFPVTNNCPVANVSWNDAQAFCQWLSKKENCTYRLPTEAEWEFACRAGSDKDYFFGHLPEGWSKYGNGPDKSLRKVQPKVTWALPEDDKFAYLAPVGSFLPNDWGIYDTHGNVIEWCQDRFQFYAPLREDSDPTVPAEVWYTHKGGSWFNPPYTATAQGRMGAPPVKRNSLIGFRVVREASH